MLRRSRYATVVVALIAGCWVSQASATRIVGPLAWGQPKTVDSSGGLQSISCPTRSLCVAGDTSGHIVWSNDPAGTSPTRHVAQVDTESSCAFATCHPGIGSVSCASQSLCVATDSAGSLFWSTEPRSSTAKWQSATIGKDPRTLNGVSCPLTTFCAIAENEGYVAVTSQPTAGASAWRTEKVASGQPCSTGCLIVGPGLGEPPFTSISCSSEALCAVGDWDGEILTSTEPMGKSQPWQRAYIDHNRVGGYHAILNAQAIIDSVACPSASACVAADEAGDVFSSDDPSGGPSAWSGYSAVQEPTKLASGQIVMEKQPLVGLTCPSIHLCLGLQNRTPLEAMGVTPPAKLYVSANPMNPSPWKTGNIDRAGRLSALSCASAALCFAVDSRGNILIGRERRHRKPHHRKPGLFAR